MASIRLKVKVLPWQDPAASVGSASRLDGADIKTWIEPCREDVTISALHERILDSFADLHGGKGYDNFRACENLVADDRARTIES